MVLQLLLNALTSFVREMTSVGMSNRMREQLFDHLLRTTTYTRKALHSADMVNRLEEDIRVLCNMVCSDVPAVIMAVFQLIASSVVLYTLQPVLLWILLIIMPIALLVSKIYFRILRRMTREIREQDSRIQGTMQENLQNRTLVLTMNRQSEVNGKLKSLQKVLRGFIRTRTLLSIRARFFVQLGFMAGYVVAFCWGAFGLLAGTVTYGMMTAFLQLVNQIQHPVVNLSHLLTGFAQAFTSIDRLRELIMLEQEEVEDPIRLNGPISIKIDNLTFAYPDDEKPTLSHFSHTFESGTSTAIMGRTGAGKSTLVRLILALLKPQEGAITLTSACRTLPASAATRCNFLYVPQGNTLLSGTIRDNLLMGNPLANDEQINEVLHLACADFVFALPDGLQTLCTEKGSGLSEGQAQRIAIARALLQPGQVLILDEACSAVDEQTEQQILKNLSTMQTEKTILWVTHHPAVREVMQHVVTIE